MDNDSPTDPAKFPTAGSDEDLRREYIDHQIKTARATGDRLMRRARAFTRKGTHAKAHARAEQDARSALAAYRTSLDWAEDTPEEDDAHAALDAAGRWVRRTFGCHLDRRGDAYSRSCPVVLAHNRIGFSIGGTAARRICSLCGNDVSECDHLPGTAYLVPGGAHDLGWCRVCCSDTTCEHDPTVTYRASVVSRIVELDVVEVSLVNKPANPLARIQSMSVPISELSEHLGPNFVPGMEVNCDFCLSPCEGLIRADLLNH